MSLTYTLVFFPSVSDHNGQEEDKDIHEFKKKNLFSSAGTHITFNMNVKASNLRAQDLKLQQFSLLFDNQRKLSSFESY